MKLESGCIGVRRAAERLTSQFCVCDETHYMTLHVIGSETLSPTEHFGGMTKTEVRSRHRQADRRFARLSI
jgi:hypothetical protein